MPCGPMFGSMHLPSHLKHYQGQRWCLKCALHQLQFMPAVTTEIQDQLLKSVNRVMPTSADKQFLARTAEVCTKQGLQGQAAAV